MDIASLLQAFASQLQVLEWSTCLWTKLWQVGPGQGAHLEGTAGAAEHWCVESGVSRAVHWQTCQEKSIADKPQITSLLPLTKIHFLFKGFSIKTMHFLSFSQKCFGVVISR